MVVASTLVLAAACGLAGCGDKAETSSAAPATTVDPMAKPSLPPNAPPQVAASIQASKDQANAMQAKAQADGAAAAEAQRKAGR